jgi:hypothetical protein
MMNTKEYYTIVMEDKTTLDSAGGTAWVRRFFTREDFDKYLHENLDMLKRGKLKVVYGKEVPVDITVTVNLRDEEENL